MVAWEIIIRTLVNTREGQLSIPVRWSVIVWVGYETYPIMQQDFLIKLAICNGAYTILVSLTPHGRQIIAQPIVCTANPCVLFYCRERPPNDFPRLHVFLP